MQVQVVSDLHLELMTDKMERKNNWSSIVQPTTPILVLAGDICQATSPPKLARLSRFLTWCSKHFETVMFVPGNHEFYNIGNPKYKHRMCSISNTLLNLENICKPLENVHLLYRSTKIINNICFIGATLWSAIPTLETAQTMKETLNDFSQIYTSETESLTPAQYNSMHIADRAFIERQLLAHPHSRIKTVVITHHAPSFLGTCHPEHEAIPDFQTQTNLLACAHASALGDLIAQSNVWIFGHTHYCVDLVRSGCHLVSNQRGYCDDICSNYSPSFTFII